MTALLGHPRRPDKDFLSGLSEAAALRHGIAQSLSPQLPEPAVGWGGAVHVVVGKSVEKTAALLRWSFSTFRGQEFCLLYVHCPSPLIPTLCLAVGKLPASKANPETIAAYRSEERKEAVDLLSTLLTICTRSRVKASVLVTEADKVQRGIVDLAVEVLNLLTDAVSNSTETVSSSLLRGKRGSCKDSHAAKYAPPYCEMWFVNKGKLVWTRQAASSSPCMPSFQSATDYTEDLESSSLKSSQDEADAPRPDTTSPSTCIQSTCDLLCEDSPSISFSLSSGNGYATSIEQMLSSSSSSTTMENCLCSQLADLKVELDKMKHEEYIKLQEKIQLESEVLKAFNKVKTMEMANLHEVKLRKDAEYALRVTIEEQEKLLEEREKTAQQLQKTLLSMALLDTRAKEANRRCEEVTGELKLIKASITSLRKEKQKLQQQQIEAMRWLDRWRNHDQSEDANIRSSFGLTDEISELPEFLLSDLETATCNFSECFMIGQGGNGTVYKGEMLDKTIAMKKLHPYSMQRQTDIQQVVQVLSKLHHPRLVELIGTCPESWLLIYEYLPGGSLYNYLYNNRLSSISWKTRAQIVADIASGLLFLHSFGHKKLVHGNLKPENLLLDSEGRCKISDYADHLLTAGNMIRCPSFRRCSDSSGASTFLYTDPESHRAGAVTQKSDIYSFGIIALQLVTGRTQGGLVGEVRWALSNGKVGNILDSSAGDWQTYVARRLLELGLQCCERNSRDRPELTPALVRELENMPILEDQIVPSFFLCPILREIMHDPQVAADGFTYEGEAIRGWLGNGHETSPMTNLKLSYMSLTPNHSLRLAIQDWITNLRST